ncbi:unnamed protein product [Effrenium voratum]|nr:unnamed protein product [Effrenium voratum]
MKQRLRRVDSFEEIRKAGLFRGVGILQVLQYQAFVFRDGLHGVVGAGTLTASIDGFDAEFEATRKVDEVDLFISHTWMSDRWLKYAAICFHLNFKLAVGISIGAWMSVICYLAATGISAWGGCRYLVLVGVYAPTLLFFLVFFLGHKLSSLAHELPTVWLDKVCIHQTNEGMKALQVNALPVFVARSREILVLWSDTLFERLWCCLELATFAKYGDVESMRFAPLWLAPWLLSSVLLDLASTSLLEVLEILIPNWTSFFMKPLNGFFAEVFHVEEGSRLAGFLAALAIWCLSGLCYLPASIPGCVAFQRKLCNHKLMLEQMSSFDIREAKCSVASDRQLVEDQAPGIDIDQQGFQEFTHIHTYIYIYMVPPPWTLVWCG